MKLYYEQDDITIYHGDCREVLPQLESESANLCVTSPPYWGLRDYGGAKQVGLELSRQEYISSVVTVMNEVRRTLRSDGTAWINLGDTYKRKSLAGVPWRVAFELEAAGWMLRQDIIWSKPNAMPESMKDRCTRAHEYLFLLTKGSRYHFNADAIATREKSVSAKRRQRADRRLKPGMDAAHFGVPPRGLSKTGSTGTANRRSVWRIPTETRVSGHPAAMPLDMAVLCVRAGAGPHGTVLDPFMGSGTTLVAAKLEGCKAIGIELEEKYCEIATKRLAQGVLDFG